MRERVVPPAFKQALVTPLIKKKTLCRNEFKNYRPQSNLSFLSKILEKIVAKRLNAHIELNNCYRTMYNLLINVFIPPKQPFSKFTMGSFCVNSTNGSQVFVSNIAQKSPKITLVSIMKACKILGCNSEYFWRYSFSNFLFCIAFLPSQLKY